MEALEQRIRMKMLEELPPGHWVFRCLAKLESDEAVEAAWQAIENTIWGSTWRLRTILRCVWEDIRPTWLR